MRHAEIDAAAERSYGGGGVARVHLPGALANDSDGLAGGAERGGSHACLAFCGSMRKDLLF
jgi:hypothetical protein